MSSSDAREKLPTLVREACSIRKPAKNLAAHAVEIGPYNKGGAWLIPAADAEAAIEREDALRAQVERLEDQLENLAIAEFVRERISTASGRKMSGIDFARSLGFDDIADEIEARRSAGA